ALQMAAELNRNTPQHQKPQYDHQCEIETAEARGVETWEREIERSARREEPDFIAIPDGPNGGKERVALRVSAGGEKMDHTRSEVEAVEDDVGGEHNSDKTKPNRFHVLISFNKPLPALRFRRVRGRVRLRARSGTGTGLREAHTFP